MRTEYEAIVLGLGGIGSGALYWLARRLGADVLGLEQHELGHDRGGSQDHSRIIRYSYHAPVYVELARRAYEAWAAVEEDAGEPLVVKTGGLDLFPPAAAITPDDYVRSLDACGVPFERLDAAEIRRRWPPFEIADDVLGLFQADGGLVAAARANAAHQRVARGHGASVRERAPVTSVRALDGGMEVTAGGTVYRCRTLVVTAGAWTNDVLGHLGRKLPLTVTLEQVTYFASPRLADFAPERFPIWIWMDDPCFYGFPVYGEPAVKVAQDVGGRETTAAARGFAPDAAAFERVRAFCERCLPSALGPVLSTKTCLYTLTPDRDFVIDAVPGCESCLVAVGAGHAFKFASAIGRILAELSLDGATGADLEPFRIDRPVLLEENPEKRFLV